MKRILILLTLLTLFTSCRKDQMLTEVDNKPILTAKLSKLMVSQPADGKWDVLGYGYDITGQYANSESATYPVIDVERFKLERPEYIVSSGAETGTHYFAAGYNAEDFSYKMTEDSEIGIGMPKVFSGTISKNSSREDKWSSKYIYGTYSTLAIKKSLKMIVDVALLKSYLHPGFLTYVETLTPEKLVEYYGTHVLTNIKLGGKLELIYSAQSRSSNRIEAAGSGTKASYKEIFNIKANDSTNETEASSNFDEQAFVRTIGGNSGASIVANITFNSEGKPSSTYNTAAWAAGVTDDNAELVSVSPGGMLPLYELIENPAKKAALKSYIDQYLINKQVKLSDQMCTVKSNNFFNAFLRLDGSSFTSNIAGSGKVNCQYGSGPFENIIFNKLSDGTYTLESANFPGLYMRMDGSNINSALANGGGSINLQSAVGEYEKFHVTKASDGSYSIASVRFPNVHLRMDARGVTSTTNNGGGVVNCQFGFIGIYENFTISPALK